MHPLIPAAAPTDRASGFDLGPAAATLPAPTRDWRDPVPRILVADDDQVICRLTRRILEGRGYAVVTAADGAAALGAIRSAMARPGTAVHLVLTDIDMPGSDGYALGRQLAVAWPALPVIYMSGTTHGLARRARLGPGEHFIQKPFSPHHLVLEIELALRRPA